LHNRGLGKLGFAVGYREHRRLARPMAEKDHFPHDIFVGQRAPGALAVPDCDFDRSRIVKREPYVRPGRWRDARSDRDRAGRKPDARAARAPVAAAHEPGERSRLEAVAGDPAELAKTLRM